MSTPGPIDVTREEREALVEEIFTSIPGDISTTRERLLDPNYCSVLSLGANTGLTGYLDYLKPTHFPTLIAIGKDNIGRPFISLKFVFSAYVQARSETSSIQVDVLTLFQRYPRSTWPWVFAGMGMSRDLGFILFDNILREEPFGELPPAAEIISTLINNAEFKQRYNHRFWTSEGTQIFEGKIYVKLRQEPPKSLERICVESLLEHQPVILKFLPESMYKSQMPSHRVKEIQSLVPSNESIAQVKTLFTACNLTFMYEDSEPLITDEDGAQSEAKRQRTLSTPTPVEDDLAEGETLLEQCDARILSRCDRLLDWLGLAGSSSSEMNSSAVLRRGQKRPR